MVAIADVPGELKNAIIAAEDERFYEHAGIDYIGVLRAAYANLVAGGRRQGASTITMQVARNFFLSSEKTLTRKLYEALLAFKIEHSLTKEQILELYVNQIYLGQRAYGFGAASQIYFGKALDKLTLAETAMLAGLPKAPSLYNPIANPQRAKQRQQYVLRRMPELGQISQAQYDEASQSPIRPRREVNEYSVHAEYAAEMVRQAIAEHFPDEVYSRGFRVYTTLRKADQEAAYAAVRKGVLEYDRRNGYRGPEGFFELPAKADEDAYEDALERIPRQRRPARRRGDAGRRAPGRGRPAYRRDDHGYRGVAALRRARAGRQGAPAAAHPPRRDHPGAARGTHQAVADRAAARGGSRFHRARPPGRLGAGAGRRLRLPPQQVQPRGPGLAPARVVLQAFHLFGRAREGLHRGDRDSRRAGGAGSRADRQPALGAEELRRQVRRSDAPSDRAGEVKEHGVDPDTRGDQPQVRPGIRDSVRLRAGQAPALPHHGARRRLRHRLADGARVLGIRQRRLPGAALLHPQDCR